MKRSGAALGLARWSARAPVACHGRLARPRRRLPRPRLGRRHQVTSSDAAGGVRSSPAAPTGGRGGGVPDDSDRGRPRPAAHGLASTIRPRMPRWRDLRTALGDLSAVRAVQPAETSADGRTQLLPVVMQDGGFANDEAISWAADHVPQLQSVVDKVASEHPSLRVEQVGDASLEASLGRQIGHDFRQAGLLSLPLTLLHPGRRLRCTDCCRCAGAARPHGGGLGDGAVGADVPPVRRLRRISSVILLIGMAVGVDYSLFYLRGEREERAQGVRPSTPSRSPPQRPAGPSSSRASR